MRKWFRWLFRLCLDCGAKLEKVYSRNDVCRKCFDDFNGATIEDLLAEEADELPF